MLSAPNRTDFDDPNDRLFGRKLYSPERNLIASLLERAVIDLKSDDQATRRSAEMWLFRSDEFSSTDFVFSFPWCMQQLGLLSVVPLFREKCREVIRLRAELGRVIICPTSNWETLFKVEAYEPKEKREEKEIKVFFGEDETE